jgi:DNA polymerase-3 subunit epsilon
MESKQKTYAVVDVETTGGMSARHRITEIAIFVHDGRQIVEEFSTLLNPEAIIPYGITRLTGISNEMVADAPRFCEVAKTIVELTRGRIFVAHHAAFDYHFIRSEFLRLGYSFKSETLCTVRLSRRLIPGQPSYSLGNLCESLQIQIHDRHRAAGDARATVILLERLLSIQQSRIQEFSDLTMADLGKEVDQRLVSGLPDETGVYYLRDPAGEILYIGKSKHIRRRVASHLADSSTKKAIRLRNAVASVDYELTGSDLVALLKESAEIKRHDPLYNRTQKMKEEAYCVASDIDARGYRNFFITQTSGSIFPLAVFAALQNARHHLQELQNQFQLCELLCNLGDASPCFAFQLKICLGGCVGEEDPETYNKRADQAAARLLGFPCECVIVDHGRTPGEYAVIRISKGACAGYGYVDDHVAGDLDTLLDAISPYKDTKDSRRIIRGWLKTGRPLKLVDCNLPYGMMGR